MLQEQGNLPDVVCVAVTRCRQTEAIEANTKGMVTVTERQNDRKETRKRHSTLCVLSFVPTREQEQEIQIETQTKQKQTNKKEIDPTHSE